MMKPKKITKHERDTTGRQAEFSLISKGIGKSYLTPQMVDWHKIETTTRVYVTSAGNKKTGLPRYYKDKIYNTEDKRKIAESRRSQESKNAQKVKDVFAYQRSVDESRKALYYKMNMKDQKGIL